MEKRLLFLAALGLAGGIGLTRLPSPEALHGWIGPDPALDAVRAELGTLRQRLADSDAELDRLRGRQRRIAEFGPLVGELACRLDETRARMADEAESRLAREELRTRVETRIEERLAEWNEGLESRWTQLQEAVHSTRHLAEAASGGLDEVRSAAADESGPDRLWTELMGPTVQLAGESTVGTGVLLASRERADGSFETHLLTAWHVVRDILADADGLERPIPVTLYAPNGARSEDSAELLEFDPTLDVALLVMSGDEPYPYGARLPLHERASDARVFEPIYAVGCPLGNDPIPTRGEIADTEHRVGDEAYWMISAPTYIGNSGGGIFDAETGELLGIFSKIYTHGNLRPTVVPHMGLVTPVDRIYDWLEQVGHASLEPHADEVGRSRVASAPR